MLTSRFSITLHYVNVELFHFARENSRRRVDAFPLRGKFELLLLLKVIRKRLFAHCANSPHIILWLFAHCANSLLIILWLFAHQHVTDTIRTTQSYNVIDLFFIVQNDIQHRVITTQLFFLVQNVIQHRIITIEFFFLVQNVIHHRVITTQSYFSLYKISYNIELQGHIVIFRCTKCVQRHIASAFVNYLLCEQCLHNTLAIRTMCEQS